MKMSLRLRDQSIVLVSLAITFLILTILKTKVNTEGNEASWSFFSKRREHSKPKPTTHTMEQQNKDLQTRSVMLLLVASVALVINVVKVPKALRVLLNLVGGLVVIAAGLLVLLNYFNKQLGGEGTLKKLKGHSNKVVKTGAIVGTVAGGVAVLVGLSHLVEGFRAM